MASTSSQNATALQVGKPPTYKFLTSGEVELPVALRLLAVEGSLSHDCFATAQLFADGKPLCPAILSGFGSFTTNGQYSWNQKLKFPVKYSILPLKTQLVITLWTTDSPAHRVPVGGTTVALFGRNRTLRMGRQKLYLWDGMEGDGSPRTRTPGKVKAESDIDRLEKLIKKYDRGQIERVPWLDRLTFQAIEKINVQTVSEATRGHAFLFVELPDFEYPVVFYQKEANQTKSVAEYTKNQVVTVFDPEAQLDANPVEQKHLAIMRAAKRRPGLGSEKDLKPNLDERARLAAIVAFPPTQHLSEDEKEMVWKFRYFLTNNKRALTKFVKSVDWSRSYDQAEAYSLVDRWEPIDVDDALELVTSTFSHLPKLRQYAVKRLETFPDDELQYYLLQLVQSLRYDKGAGNSDMCNFLIRRSVANPIIGNYIYWYMKVETEDPNASELYQRMLKDFLTQLTRLAGKEQIVQDFQQQEHIITQWMALAESLRKQQLLRNKKIEKAREMIKEGGEFSWMSSFSPITFPLDPSIKVVGVQPDDLYFFKSKLEPMRITMKTQTDQAYQLIFKIGDDLRQDQLMVQMISLMDRLLKRENLDLKLSPYKVLATSRGIGMLECIQNSKNINDVVKDYGKDTLSLQKFLAKHNPDSNGPFGIKPQALNNFVRSCAGYCVITFILGIGDRHLDNVLMCYDGRMFHIDFGFVLGRDPKPFAPPFKLSPQMVACMGGANSPYYNEFKTYCCEAFNILRKHASLILNMFSLMKDASIPDINQGDKSVLKVKEKLVLEKSDEQASRDFQTLINDTARSVMPVLNDIFHDWANYWRD